MYTAFLDLLSIILASCGLLVALHIYSKKKTKKMLICPMRMSCEAVVSSRYSTLFGIPLEVFGMGYYLFIIAIYAAHAVLDTFFSPVVVLVLLCMSALAFLFSLYLLSVQAFILKHWCSWCLMSSFSSMMIFVLVLAKLL